MTTIKLLLCTFHISSGIRTIPEFNHYKSPHHVNQVNFKITDVNMGLNILSETPRESQFNFLAINESSKLYLF